MKKLSFVLLVSLLISMIAYGEDLWQKSGSQYILPVEGIQRVGMGTASPQSKLDVRGTIMMTGFKLTTGGSSGYVLTSNGSGVGTWQALPGGGGESYWAENGNHKIYCTDMYGRVGIRTDSPISALSVGGDGNSDYAIYGYNAVGVCGQSIPAGSYYSAIGVLGKGDDFGIKADAYTGSGLGIGVYSSGHAYDFYAANSSGKSYFAGEVDIGAELHVGGNSIITGNVGIGTQNPQSKLAVNGTIIAKEIEVQLEGWSDFVFEDDYKLMPLSKLEKHIKKEKSLPGIPKEKEITENGVKLGDMQAKLLEKVEELTLYIIEQDKKLTKLEEENKELRQKISSLSN